MNTIHRFQRYGQIVAIGLVFSLLSGCLTVGPDYLPPTPDEAAPTDWQADYDRLVSTNTTDLAVWWQQLQDPVLTELILATRSSNRDLAQAYSRELAAQSARVGVATADLYPRFRFNGVLNFNAAETGSLFDTAGQSARFGPSFSWNLFHAGSIRNNIRVQNERQQQALLQYEQTVLLALEETENALVAYQQERERYQHRQDAATSAQTAADLAYDLFNDGIKDFILVLDTQRTLLEADDQRALSGAETTIQLIRLYKALGGGWLPPETNELQNHEP